MNPDYCSCNDFEKAVDYNDIHYFRPEDDKFNAIKKQGWYIFDMGYQCPITNIEPFKYLSVVPEEVNTSTVHKGIISAGG